MHIRRAQAPDGRIFTRLSQEQFHVKGCAAAPSVATALKAVAVPDPAGHARKSVTAYSAALVTRLTEDWPIAVLSADAATRWSLRQLRARSRDLERNGSIHNAYLNALEADIIGHRGIGVQMKVREATAREVTDPHEQKFLKALLAETEAFKALDRGRKLRFAREARENAWKAAVIHAAKADALFTEQAGQMSVPGGELDRYACFTVEEELREFSKKGHCEVTGKHSLMDLCRLTLRTAARDGDALLLVYLGYPNKWGVAFQLIEGDYLDDYYNVERLPNGNRIRMGVELDPFGRKVAYWVFAHHPGDYGVEGVNSYDPRRRRIAALGEPPDPYFTDGRPEAVQAIHVTKSKRAEETRGVPWITPAMGRIHHIEAYVDAEITAAREEACKHLFYERDLMGSDGTEIEWDEKDGELTDEMQPGGATNLPPGYRANFVDPKHPNDKAPDFLKAMKREVAAAVNYCYNLLFGDLEAVNYSSLRGGLLQQREGSKMDQAWFGSDAFSPMLEIWLKMSLLAGALPFRMGEYARLCQYELKFRRWPWVDPKNDAETAQLLLQMKVTTRGRIIADMASDDFEATIDELDYEEGYIAAKPHLALAEQKAAGEGVNPQTSEPPAAPQNAAVKGSPDQPRAEDGKWSGSSIPAHLGPLTAKWRTPTDEERAFVDNFDESDASTWGRHATPEVLAAAPLADPEAHATGHPDDWAADQPETEHAQELAAFLDDPEYVDFAEWPVFPEKQAAAKAAKERLEALEEHPLTPRSDAEELIEVSHHYLSPEEETRFTAAVETSDNPETAPEERAAAEAAIRELRPKIVAGHTAATRQAKGEYQVHEDQAVATAKAGIAEQRTQLKGRIKEARTVVAPAQRAALRDHERLSELVDEHDAEQETIHTRAQLLTLRDSRAFDPHNREHQQLVAEDQDFHPEDWAAA